MNLVHSYRDESRTTPSLSRLFGKHDEGSRSEGIAFPSRASLRERLEDHPHPMVLVGLDRGLVFANVAFRDMRASSRPVIVSDGRLSNFDGRASRTVHAMVCDAAGGLTSCALVARDDSSGGVNPSSLALWSCAIGPADAELVAAFSIGRPLLKLVLKRQSVDASRLAPLRKIFDLTAAELRVVQLLADGLRPDEVAGQCGTSVSTVRTHLQTIYSKTGVRSQTQLVRVALMAALT